MSRINRIVMTCDGCHRARVLEDGESLETLRLHGWHLPIGPKGYAESAGDLCPECADEMDGVNEPRKTVRVRLHVVMQTTREIDVVTRVPRSCSGNDLLALLRDYWPTLDKQQTSAAARELALDAACKLVAVTPLDWDLEKEMA